MYYFMYITLPVCIIVYKAHRGQEQMADFPKTGAIYACQPNVGDKN